MIPSLYIRNFRAFDELHVPDLGRVNLITGVNNVGKTSLLEAIAVYARSGLPGDLANLLEARDELRHRGPVGAVRALFHASDESLPIEIGHGPETELLTLRRAFAIHQKERGRGGKSGSRWEISDVRDPADEAQAVIVASRPGFNGYFPANHTTMRDTDVDWQELCACVFVFAEGLVDDETAELWRQIAGYDYEDDVVRALQIIEPRIERVHFVKASSELARTEDTSLYCRVRLRDSTDPVPLRQFGDGVSRLLSIALAMVNCKNGVLLIDEFENGLHYRIQADVWSFVFQLAAQLNVQVFATTHSWDCISAFQAAAAASATDGKLVRLYRDGASIRSRVFSKEALSIVTRQEIEVR